MFREVPGCHPCSRGTAMLPSRSAMSVRRLFQVAATVLLAVTVAVAGCLVVAGVAMRRAERRLAETSATVRDAEGVELAILVHNRAIHLHALTQDPKYGGAAA